LFDKIKVLGDDKSPLYEKLTNIRKDFCHKTTRAIVDKKETKIIILEDLKTSQMTKRPKPKKDKVTNKWKSNRRKCNRKKIIKRFY